MASSQPLPSATARALMMRSIPSHRAGTCGSIVLSMAAAQVEVKPVQVGCQILGSAAAARFAEGHGL